MIARVRAKLLQIFGGDLKHLQREVIELNDPGELRKVFGWKSEPVLDDPSIREFEYLEDVNQRRLRDAESLATVVCNARPSVCLDIGTSSGHSAACMAANAPNAKIFTINITADDLRRGQGGTLTTAAVDPDQIGSYYRDRKLSNITQLIANTAHWEPQIGTIDVAFVDGCHDAEFVYNDTREILKHVKPGSFILWHDFNLDLVRKYHWIYSVCLGVEMLFMAGLIRGRIYHIRDSWIGVHRVS